MKLKYTIKKDTLKGVPQGAREPVKQASKKVYTLKQKGTKDAHYKFVKIKSIKND